jgi:hypothetical protein
MSDLAAQALSKLAAADGQAPVTLSAAEGAALLEQVADLDLAAARYRVVRTHQYMGVINFDEPCDANSPAAIQFDRMVDRQRLSLSRSGEQK